MRRVTFRHLGIVVGLCVGAGVAAVGIDAWQFRTVRDNVETHVLTTAQATLAAYHRHRMQRLQDATRPIASNPSFVSYVAQALSPDTPAQTLDVASVRDLLEERRKEAGLSALAILDVKLHVIAISGSNILPERALAASALVKRALQDGNPAIGLLDDAPAVPLIAVMPLTRGAGVEALLVSAQPIDDAEVRAMADASRVDVGVAVVAGDGVHLLHSTLGAPAPAGLEHDLASRRDLFPLGTNSPPTHMAISSDDVHGLVFALDPGHAHAFVLALVPAARWDGLHRSIYMPLLFAAMAAWLLIGSLAVLATRRIFGPLAVLADLSERGAAGDHRLQIPLQGSATITRTMRAVNLLLADLDRYRIPAGTPRRRATDSPQ